MPDGYSWSEMRDGGGYRLPGPEHLGWWAAVALLASILLHIIVFFTLDRMGIALSFEKARELSTAGINVTQVEVRPMPEMMENPTPEDIVVPPAETSELLDEIEILEKLPENMEIDIKPDVLEPEYALKMENPALQGEPAEIAATVATGMELDDALPELGSEMEQLRPAEIGQVTVDPGDVEVEDDALGKLAHDLIERGAGGNTREGTLDGMATLDDMLSLSPNVLQGKKTMLPSDLLFAFNSAEVLDSAKVGLMKLALLIDRNPGMYCWIEGHTDLVGGDEFNLDLSVRRAEAVKQYLVNSFRMDPERICTRGFGRYEPIVTSGDVDAQSVNRRVEIRMRKTPPSEKQLQVAPQKAIVVPEENATTTPEARKPVLVKPQRAIPVEDLVVEPEPAAPRATIVPEEDIVPPLRDEPQFAPVVPESGNKPLRALPVEEE